jgi:hypothetical protein
LVSVLVAGVVSDRRAYRCGCFSDGWALVMAEYVPLIGDVVKITTLHSPFTGCLGWVREIETANTMRTGYVFVHVMDKMGDFHDKKYHANELRFLA